MKTIFHLAGRTYASGVRKARALQHEPEERLESAWKSVDGKFLVALSSSACSDKPASRHLIDGQITFARLYGIVTVIWFDGTLSTPTESTDLTT
jgi:hypothetical protein